MRKGAVFTALFLLKDYPGRYTINQVLVGFSQICLPCIQLSRPELTLILVSHHLSPERKAQFTRVFTLPGAGGS